VNVFIPEWGGSPPSLPFAEVKILGKKEGNTMICLGEEPDIYMSDLRESFEELSS